MNLVDDYSTDTFHDEPARDQAVAVVRRLQQAGFKALWAGGCVRDFLLGLRPSDYDVATDAVPDQVRQLFGERHTLAIGAAFGVILVRGPGGVGDVEVATFRTEGPYNDGRRPERVVFSTPEEDAQRRDFTINGLFYDPLSEQLFDYVGGRDDLRRKVLRAIGDPLERFTEDKLRILRAVRISSRFGLELDVGTAEAIRQMANQITVVSQERIAQELKKILTHPTRRQAIERGATLGILEVVIPELREAMIGRSTSAVSHETPFVDWLATLDALGHLNSPDFELGLATLLLPIGGAGNRPAAAKIAAQICRRLKLSTVEGEQTSWLVERVSALEEMPGATLAMQKKLLGHRWGRNLIALSRAVAIARGGPPTSAEYCERFLDGLSERELRPEPVVTGDDLIRMQLSPGKRFKEILGTLYDLQLEGEIENREEGLKWISDHLKDG